MQACTPGTGTMRRGSASPIPGSRRGEQSPQFFLLDNVVLNEGTANSLSAILPQQQGGRPIQSRMLKVAGNFGASCVGFTTGKGNAPEKIRIVREALAPFLCPVQESYFQAISPHIRAICCHSVYAPELLLEPKYAEFEQPETNCLGSFHIFRPTPDIKNCAWAAGYRDTEDQFVGCLQVPLDPRDAGHLFTTDKRFGPMAGDAVFVRSSAGGEYLQALVLPYTDMVRVPEPCTITQFGIARDGEPKLGLSSNLARSDLTEQGFETSIVPCLVVVLLVPRVLLRGGEIHGVLEFLPAVHKITKAMCAPSEFFAPTQNIALLEDKVLIGVPLALALDTDVTPKIVIASEKIPEINLKLHQGDMKAIGDHFKIFEIPVMPSVEAEANFDQRVDVAFDMTTEQMGMCAPNATRRAIAYLIGFDTELVITSTRKRIVHKSVRTVLEQYVDNKWVEMEEYTFALNVTKTLEHVLPAHSDSPFNPGVVVEIVVGVTEGMVEVLKLHGGKTFAMIPEIPEVSFIDFITRTTDLHFVAHYPYLLESLVVKDIANLGPQFMGDIERFLHQYVSSEVTNAAEIQAAPSTETVAPCGTLFATEIGNPLPKGQKYNDLAYLMTDMQKANFKFPWKRTVQISSFRSPPESCVNELLKDAIRAQVQGQRADLQRAFAMFMSNPMTNTTTHPFLEMCGNPAYEGDKDHFNTVTVNNRPGPMNDGLECNESVAVRVEPAKKRSRASSSKQA